ncbi:GvpL/GvpF family gas vesicle protein [Streptomyces sp. NPDC035033]|uniref:GvpL/GvpF family gas vesicle protein n=1 Tax=Streptomyces sp. NPDC035033 TaxID=3155368 RepID=UPI0033D2BC14
MNGTEPKNRNRTREPGPYGPPPPGPPAAGASETPPGTVRSGSGPRRDGPATPGTRAYVYGIGRDDGRLDALAGTTGGVDGHGVRLVPAGGLVALVSDVPAPSFDEEALRRRLEDLDGLEELARAHHTVVDAAFAHDTVLPLRLATVYTDEGRVTDTLLARRAAFTELLAWLGGHVELGVKVFVDPAAAPDAPPDAAPDPSGPTGPGRAYLRRRRLQRRGTEDLHRAAEQVTGRVDRATRELARAVVAHRTQRGELSGERGVNVANHAYLVPTGAEARFRAEAEAAGAGVAGVRVEVTGPWAPYSFATPVSEAGEGGADPS